MNFTQSFPEPQQIYPSNWQQMYNQLLFSYYQLSQNFRTAVNKNFELTEQLKLKTQIFNQAEKLLSQSLSKVQSKKTLPEQSELLEETIKESQKIQRQRSIRKRRPHRKGKATISNLYTCSYPQCNRCYDSSVSLNLHIKLKHNGGTKKERQTYAKMIIDAQEKGMEPPAININFPPNFIEDFRISYKYMKKYSM